VTRFVLAFVRSAIVCSVLALSPHALAQAARAAPPALPQPHAAKPPPNHTQSIPRDLSAPAPDLPKGTIEAIIVDGNEQPLVGHEVRLGIVYQSVAEGESRSEKFQKTDNLGRARFDGLSVQGGYSYRVVLKSGIAEYASMPIVLAEDMGQRLSIHVFPVTDDVDKAYVGIRGITYVETRDDLFQFQVMYRVFNLGGVTWVPRGVRFSLPTGFKAFTADRSMTDQRFEANDSGVELRGTFTPGQHDVSFRFQVEKDRVENAYFSLGLLPHVYEMRVIAAASAAMKLDVPGFEVPQVDQTQNGQRVLVTRRLFNATDNDTKTYSIGLHGLPVPGPGRWIAALIAALLAASGFAAAWGYLSFDAPGKAKRDEELNRARNLILEELVEVERSRRLGALGPRAHSEARRILVDALARLGTGALAQPRAKRPGGAAKSKKGPAEQPARPSTG
jgi:hypothetical protein